MTPEQQRKHPKLALVWKIVSITFGSILILLGIVSGFIPLVQGWVLILAGLALLSPHSRLARKVLHWLREKFRLHKKHPADNGVESPSAPAAQPVEPEGGSGRDRQAGL
ncbi:MAG TPA: PGPGW domain-containing protein [Candidatus Polarisedimenticolia bacterium]|nr:PGPGW domain-containing protein [Candidatus Polarisedimenticolia bacterium]